MNRESAPWVTHDTTSTRSWGRAAVRVTELMDGWLVVGHVWPHTAESPIWASIQKTESAAMAVGSKWLRKNGEVE